MAGLDVQVLDLQRVFLNKLTARLHRVTHQYREDLIRGHVVLHLHLEEGAGFRILSKKLLSPGGDIRWDEDWALIEARKQ